MGRAIGLKLAFFAGARVAGKHDPNGPKHMIYVPAHLKNGNFISQRSSFTAYVNSNRGKKDASGKVLGDMFSYTAWGKLADATARSMSVGRALDTITTPTSFLKPITDPMGNAVMNRGGTQLMIPTVSFRIDQLVFGEEAASVVANELATGVRPPGWDDQANQQAQTLWRQICANNNAAVPDYASLTFVNARIIIPTGPGIQLCDPETRQPISIPAANTAGVMQAAGAVMNPAPSVQIPAGYVMQADGTLVQAAAAPIVAGGAPVPNMAPNQVQTPPAHVIANQNAAPAQNVAGAVY